MKKAILATKVGMTQIFNEDGTLIPVTVLQAGPCVVTQVKTVENDGYKAVQVGFVDKKDRIVNKDKSGKKEVIHRHGVNKALKGHFEKAGVSSKRYLREFRFENAEEYALGNEIKADIFAAGDKVDASAKKIIETVKKNGSQVSGPVPLPTKKEVVTILRAVHKYKDSREQFEQRTHKRLIDIIAPTPKTVDALQRLEMPAGVYIDIKMKNK